jgi:hypothetical protein
MDIDKFIQLYNNYHEDDIIINLKLHIGYNILINFMEHKEDNIIDHVKNNKDYYLLLADRYLSVYGDMFNQINEIVYIMFLIICECLVDIKKIIPDIDENITMENLNIEIYYILNIILVLYKGFIDEEEHYLYIPDKLKLNDETITWEDLTNNIYKTYNKGLILDKIGEYRNRVITELKIDSDEYELNEELINSLILYFIIIDLKSFEY